MRRKVVMHGPSTLTVSLPTQWVKKHNISKGDELEVEELGKTLKVSIEKEYIPFKVGSVDVSHLSPISVSRTLSVLCRSGYDQLSITFSDKEALKEIEYIVNNYHTGFEIIDQTQKVCTIRAIATNESQEYDNVVRRAFLVSILMAKQTLSSVIDKKYDSETVQEIYQLEIKNNKLTGFCQRLLNKNLQNREYVVFEYLIMWLLESICDDFRKIITYCVENDYSADKKFISLLEEVCSEFNKYYDLYYKYNAKKADASRAALKKIIKNVEEYVAEGNKDVILYINVFNIAERIFDSVSYLIPLNQRE